MRSNYVFLYKETITDENGKGKGGLNYWAHFGRTLELF